MKTLRASLFLAALVVLLAYPVRAENFLLKEIAAHNDDIWAMAYSSSGAHLATAGKDKLIKLWKPGVFTLEKTLQGQHTQGVVAMAFSPNSRYLVSSGQDKQLVIWRMDILAGAAKIADSEQVTYSLAFSPDGRFMAAGGLDGVLRIYRSVVFRQHKTQQTDSGIFALAYSDDGKYLASAHAGGVVNVWDAKTFVLLKTLKEHSDDVLAVAFSPDGTHLVSGGKDKLLRVWSVPAFDLANTLSGSEGAVLNARFSVDAKYLAAAGEDKNIRVWETAEFRYLLTLSGHKSSVDSLAFAPDGKTLVSASEDRTVRIWSADWGAVVPTAAPPAVSSSAAQKVEVSTAAAKSKAELELDEKYKKHFDSGASLLGMGLLSEAEAEFRAAEGFKKTPEVAEKLVQLAARQDAIFKQNIAMGGAGLLFVIGAVVYILRRKKRQPVVESSSSPAASAVSSAAGKASGKMSAKIRDLGAAGKHEKALKTYRKHVSGGGAPDVLEAEELYSLFDKNAALDGLLEEKLSPAYLSAYLKKFSALKRYDLALQAYEKLKSFGLDNFHELVPQSEAAALFIDSGKLDLLAREKIPASEVVGLAFKFYEGGKEKEAFAVLSHLDALADENLPMISAAHLVEMYSGAKKETELVKALQDKQYPRPAYSQVAAAFGNKAAHEHVIAVLEAGVKYHGKDLRDADYQQLAASYSGAGKMDEMKPELVPDEYKYHMVEALMEKGKNAEALKVLNQRPQDKWGDKDFHLCMQLYIRLDMYDLAEEMVVKMQATKPVADAPEFYYDFATYCEKTEKLEKAAEIYKQFILTGVTFRDVVLRYPALRDKIISKDDAASPAPVASASSPADAAPPLAAEAVASAAPAPEAAPAPSAAATGQTAAPAEQPAGTHLLSQASLRQISRLEDDGRRIAALKGGKLKLEKEIGRGGMGIVYSVMDSALNRRVAVKRMLDELYLSKKEVQKFLNEARTVAQLNHPNIVIVYEILELEDMAYILFEYIDGTSLENMLAGAPKGLRFNEALRIIEQVCNGLSYAHSHNVVHRDLKPSNIMLANDGLVKITDFGIARVAKDTILRLTGASTGTLAYMSPEQELGQCDPSADIYSLGVVIYEILTGELPFKGPNFYLQKEKMVYKPILDLSPELPKKVDAVITKCLQADKKERYSSVDEVLRDMLSSMR